MTEELEQLLKNLKLRRVLEVYNEQLGAAEKEDVTYSEFLTRLVRAQWHARQEGALEWRIQRANLPERWSLESFPFARQPGVNRKQIRAFAEGGYVTLLVMVGLPTGVNPPAWLRQTSSSTALVGGILQGAQPVTPTSSSTLWTAWTVNNCNNDGTCDTYAVLDLGRIPAFNTTDSLSITMRNTMANAFACSAASVPFSMAEFTNADGAGGGLMGPYAPLVDYAGLAAACADATKLL